MRRNNMHLISTDQHREIALGPYFFSFFFFFFFLHIHVHIHIPLPFCTGPSFFMHDMHDETDVGQAHLKLREVVPQKKRRFSVCRLTSENKGISVFWYDILAPEYAFIGARTKLTSKN